MLRPHKLTFPVDFPGAQQGIADLRLDVDGYPRAMSFEVDLEHDAQQAEPRREI